MTETRRVDSESARATADRDSRAEALLVDGLDRYFAGDFENAIHLWTRVLFLDRHHTRARAYIERARSAQSERLRRGDEMLQATETLITEGDIDRARSLLTQATRLGADDGRVAQLWTDLERRNRVRPLRGPEPDRQRRAATVTNVRVVVTWLAALSAVGAVTALAVTVATSPVVRDWITGPPSPLSGAGISPSKPPARLSPDQVALVRAQTFVARGRLAEALLALESIVTPEARRMADTMRIEIQQTLLATVPPDVADESLARTGRP